MRALRYLLWQSSGTEGNIVAAAPLVVETDAEFRLCDANQRNKISVPCYDIEPLAMALMV